jgi:type I phosphodiesterase/nucleotide pyrophosphatase
MARLALLTMVVLVVLGIGAMPAAARSGSLSGPQGTSLNKVLVIGIDGTRWDLLDAAIKSGRARNLARLRRAGFGRPSLLEYGPGTLTLSEVGWSSIASGVWEDKHGVDGTKLNMDPGQATKNGYLDFLTRVERARPRTSTFLASDWDNIGLAENGGPIFGTAMDTNYAARVLVETIAAWDEGDRQVTLAASHYLRFHNPDVGFVYLGVVDESAHLAGSATPTYANAIATTDRRIGRILAAIRARPTYLWESWTILITTDHGQRPLTEPSIVSHLTDTPLERTSFLIGSGPGLRASVTRPRVVDILPTVLHQIGLRTRARWNIDGRSLSRARPASAASARLRGRKRLITRLRLGHPPRGARSIRLRLPVRATSAAARLNGRRVKVRVAGRSLVVSLRKHRLRSVSFYARLRSAPRSGRTVRVAVRSKQRALGRLRVPLSR